VNNLAQWVAVGASIGLLVLVLELVRRRRLSEEYSFIWILSSVALIILSLARGALDRLALRLGILYGPALLLLVLIFFVTIAALHFSLVISRQRRQIDQLIEDVALLEAGQRRLTEVVGPPADSSASSRPRRVSSGRRS
jgi:hypothetical protein